MQKVLRPIRTQWVKLAQLWALPFFTTGRHRVRQIWTLCKLFIFNRTLTTPTSRSAVLPQSCPHTLLMEDGFLCVLFRCSVLLTHSIPLWQFSISCNRKNTAYLLFLLFYIIFFLCMGTHATVRWVATGHLPLPLSRPLLLSPLLSRQRMSCIPGHTGAYYVVMGTEGQYGHSTWSIQLQEAFTFL